MIKDYLARILGKEPKKQVYRDYVFRVVDGNTFKLKSIPILSN